MQYQVKQKINKTRVRTEESKSNDTLKHIAFVTDENKLERAVKGFNNRCSKFNNT